MSEYKRLTNKDWKENYDIFEDVCCDTCAEDCGECERSFNALVRLAELEDKIENGMLIELPCKVGDTVYRVYEECNGSSCPYNGNYEQWRCHYKGKKQCKAFIDEKKFSYEMLNDIEKSIFVVKGEAEAKLKKLQEKE